ncbi:MAG: GNAT family N-acetyltransferase [Acidimicrobiia bacterium]
MSVTIEEVDEVTDRLVEALGRLVSQLSGSATAPGRAELEAIVGSPATTLLVARRGVDIVGSLTLAVFPLPTGVRAWIEDVVVDQGSRGQGIGRALSLAALERARELGAKTVDLTSRPSRRAANALYQSIGFQRRDTNVYRFDLG